MELNYTLNDIENVAKKVLENINSRTLLLYGSMGTGKTTLTKALVKALECEEVVSSPTFSLVNEYETKQNETIYHFDLYRVNDLEEVYNIGIEDYLYSGHWIIIEWPEIIEDLLPKDANSIHLDQISNESRILKLNLT